MLKIFDIPEEKQADWNCEVEPMPAELFEICSDYRRPRTPLEAKNVTVQYNGIVHMLLIWTICGFINASCKMDSP